MTLRRRLAQTALALIFILPHDYLGLIMWAISVEYHWVDARSMTMTIILIVGCLLSVVLLAGAVIGWNGGVLAALVFSQVLLWPIAIIAWRVITYYDPIYR